jgi:hypothetical protein
MFGTRAYMKITSIVPFLKSYKPITEVVAVKLQQASLKTAQYNATCFSRIRNLITGQFYL